MYDRQKVSGHDDLQCIACLALSGWEDVLRTDIIAYRVGQGMSRSWHACRKVERSVVVSNGQGNHVPFML